MQPYLSAILTDPPVLSGDAAAPFLFNSYVADDRVECFPAACLQAVGIVLRELLHWFGFFILNSCIVVQKDKIAASS